MNPYRRDEQTTPPEPQQITDVAITRFEGVYEVDPKLMQEHVRQQAFPKWDTLRIVASRHDHLDWMHRHWADVVVSGAQVLEQLEDGRGDA